MYVCSIWVNNWLLLMEKTQHSKQRMSSFNNKGTWKTSFRLTRLPLLSLSLSFINIL